LHPHSSKLNITLWLFLLSYSLLFLVELFGTPLVTEDCSKSSEEKREISESKKSDPQSYIWGSSIGQSASENLLICFFSPLIHSIQQEQNKAKQKVSLYILYNHLKLDC